MADEINSELDKLFEEVDRAIDAVDDLALTHSMMVKTLPAAKVR